MLQVSGSWMPASHLFAEHVSDFSRVYLHGEILTVVPCKGLAFVL